ncbi:tripartite tricarboxylate transporter substrate binding protein [Lentibacillus sp. CBA3610]|nr:tripartite tricarboxylate transporter substrate binding protein [Lentibacillus sp. CBA3610]
MFVTILMVTLVSVLAACSDGANSAPNYPDEDITVIQGFDPGGGSDQLAQVTQPYLQENLGVSFNNEYIPGSAGAIGWTRVAQQSPNDGYTISITNGPMLMTNYLMNDEISYSLEDFEPIANVVTDPGVIVVPADSEFETYEEFANYLSENPGDLTASNSGVGGDDFFTQLKWMEESGLDMELIPYDGDGPSWQAAAGGDVDVSFNNLGVVYQQIQEGNLRALAVFSEERIEMVPDVPTASELGLDVVSGSSRGYSAPADIPEEAKERLIEAFAQLEDNEEFQEDLDNLALPMDLKLGDEYAEYLEEEEKTSADLWEEVKDQYEQ